MSCTYFFTSRSHKQLNGAFHTTHQTILVLSFHRIFNRKTYTVSRDLYTASFAAIPLEENQGNCIFVAKDVVLEGSGRNPLCGSP
jgi:hypothetical protein